MTRVLAGRPRARGAPALPWLRRRPPLPGGARQPRASGEVVASSHRGAPRAPEGGRGHLRRLARR
eukprot:6122862-Alexandrium_andersonii.AAC.1